MSKAVNLKNQIKNLQLEKETLELQVKSIAKGEFASEELFKLNQEKEALEIASQIYCKRRIRI